MRKELVAKYRGSCLASSECFTDGKVYPGEKVAWMDRAAVVHLGACEDVWWKNQFASREREQEREAFMSDPDMQYAMGQAQAEHIKSTRSLFGEAAAAQEELAWELKLGDDY